MVRRSDTWMALVAAGIAFIGGAVILLEGKPAFLRGGVAAVGVAVLLAGAYVGVTGPGVRRS